jgi:short-subunit dehydrogenase
VLLVARRGAVLERAAEHIRSETKAEVGFVAADITGPDAISLIESALIARHAYADVLVNSAGIGLAGPFAEQSPEGLMRLVDLNVRALTALTRHFLADMRIRGRGGILNVASLGGYAPGPNQAIYYASKAYVLSLTEAIASETAGEGVRVCALAPGPVETDFHARMGVQQAFYRTLLPQALARRVAQAGYLGFVLGWRVTIPGLVNPLLALAMRLLPHRIVIPIVGWLLQLRGQSPDDARR